MIALLLLASATAAVPIEHRAYDCALDVRDKVRLHFTLHTDDGPGAHSVNPRIHVADDIETTFADHDPIVLNYDFGNIPLNRTHEMCIIFNNAAGLPYVFNFDPLKPGAHKASFYLAHNQCNDAPRADDIVATGTCHVHVSFSESKVGKPA
ncbi:MAG: hypothetical protein KGQ42_08050 [Alphaproteobacteria bacterium]|nr:hypothetical protein [Alphaproteobacteria bacterium]MDE2339530.1 hypothetical protein [Alphaproteobacteria bacterium]